MNSTLLKRSLSAPLLIPSNPSSTTRSEPEHSPIHFKVTTSFIPTPTNNGYKLLDTISTHIGPISCLALCGEFILSASQGKDIIVWQQPTLRLFTKFGTGQGSIKAILVTGNKVITGHQDNRIRVWKLSRKSENMFRLVNTLPTKVDKMSKLLKQSNYVEIRRHHAKLWIEHADSISCLAVWNGMIYSGSWDKTFKVWRVGDFKCLLSIKAHDDAINGLVVGKDGLVYSASADGMIKVWEFVHQTRNKMINGSVEEQSDQGSHFMKAMASLEGQKDTSMNAVIIDDMDGTVYGGGSDGWLMGWRRIRKENEWKMVVKVKAHEMAILCLCFMGQTFLCSGSSDKSICIWKRDSFIDGIVKVGVIRGHQGPVKCLQASPNSVGFGDGYLLYSGSLDKTLKVWWVSKEITDDETKPVDKLNVIS